MNGKRLACAVVPDFLLYVAASAGLHVWERPHAIAEKEGAAALLAAVNSRGMQDGVTVGMTVAQARARCPELKVTVRNQDHEDEQSGRILKLLQSIGPFVEEEAPGVYYLQAAGLTRLYHDEAGLADRILSGLRPADYPVQVGIAANKLVARIAARLSESGAFTIVTAGTEAQFLSPLTVTHLSLPLEIIETLYDLGIKTIGQLAAFPPNEITQRFGAEVLALARLARGDDPVAFLPEPAPDDLSHRLALEYTVFSTGALCAHLGQVISPLLASLLVAGQGCQTMIVELGCEDLTVKTIPVACDRPTASASVFLRQFRTALERCRLPGGVIDIVVRIPAVVTLSGEQTEWNTTLMAASYKQDTLPAELEQCGVYAATPQRRLLPEQGATFVPLRTAVKHTAVVGDSPAVGYPSYALRSVGGLRLLTPPEKVSAVMQAGMLHSIRIGGVVESVLRQHGPWRLSGGWWQTAFDRLYYEVETAGQRVFLLFFDRLSAKWFVQGVFD